MKMEGTGLPDIGSVQGKVWGETQLIFAFNGVESHLLAVKEGGYCSRHHHQSKWNRFHVLVGKLIVRIFSDVDDMDETVLGPGAITDVPPGVCHEFEATEPTIAVEYCWMEMDPADIDRDGTVGGIRSKEEKEE